ncbi:L-lactate permease [Maribacter arcticus]|uniref:L-lactate permease n=1 Tax=Maribacter arcticus TaxID=561365 RepID=A0A1T5CH48_9FLAO|nr:L-lactate permease [Maribacter arcticus]SKB58798.1 L-lactate permease [Maribacter arcticus]
MEHLILIIAFIGLLVGVFLLKRLWLGALFALGLVILGKTYPAGLYVPIANGLIITAELGLLIFGAYLFYNLLSAHRHFKEFDVFLNSFSSKLSVVIILCWFMGSFMEGIAGFGIPAMLIAPLMLALGFKPITSIILPLAANTTAVAFGALGTPLKIGLGIFSSGDMVLYTLLLNSLPALMMPFVLAFLYSKTEQVKINWPKERKKLLGAGVCFVVPYFITGLFTVEYPSAIAGFIGLILFVSIFIPKKETPKLSFWWNSFYPYLLFVGLLLTAKFLMSGYTFKWNGDLKEIPLYQPGLVFVFAGLVYLIIKNYKSLSLHILTETKRTISRIYKPITTILLLVCFVQLINPELNGLMQGLLTDNPKLSIPLIALAGVGGSFVTGSATMSNLLLGNSIQTFASMTLSTPLLLALLHTGSAVGNAISLQNIIMVKSVIQQPVREEKIVSYNLITVSLYMTLSMLIAVLLVRYR